jgi:hypothetical protein
LRFYEDKHNKTWNILQCNNRNWRNKLYEKKKIITLEWLKEMGPRGLAYYFLDDGTYSHSKNHFVEFAIMGFEQKDIKIFCNWLLDSFSIETNIFKASHDTRFNKLPPTDRKLLRVRINKLESVKKFFFLIGPYLPKIAKDIGKTPIKINIRCKKCDSDTYRTFYCDKCLWEDAKNQKSTQYKGLTTKYNIFKRFKNWPKGEYTETKKHKIDDWITQFYTIFGSKQNCEKVIYIKEIKYLNKEIKIQNKQKEVETYDLEVEDNHNYILSNGLLVSNSLDYSTFQGTLTHGYGKGTVKIHDRDKIEILNSRPGHISWNLYKGTGPIEYTLHEVVPQLWRMTNRTQTKEKNLDLNTDKPKYKDLQDPNKILELGENYLLQEKIDGASALINFKKKGDPIRVFSTREPKRGNTGLIEYTHKIPSIMNARTDDDTAGTILRGEIYAIDPVTKRATHPAVIGGLLNSNVWKSREKQKQYGELKSIIYDIIKYKEERVLSISIFIKW